MQDHVKDMWFLAAYRSDVIHALPLDPMTPYLPEGGLPTCDHDKAIAIADRYLVEGTEEGIRSAILARLKYDLNTFQKFKNDPSLYEDVPWMAISEEEELRD